MYKDMKCKKNHCKKGNKKREMCTQCGMCNDDNDEKGDGEKDDDNDDGKKDDDKDDSNDDGEKDDGSMCKDMKCKKNHCKKGNKKREMCTQCGMCNDDKDG